MKYERLLTLADKTFGAPTRGDFDLELIMTIVPEFADGCSIELFGRGLPLEKAAIWSPFRKILKSDAAVAFGLDREIGAHPANGGDLSEEEARILMRIGVRSAIGVPIRLGRRIAGSLSVCMGSSGRTFVRDDFACFQEIGGRLEGSLTEEWLEGTQPIKLARGEDLSLLARKHSFGRLERYAAERELEVRRRRQDAVAELAGRAIAEPEIRVLLDVVAKRVAEVLDVGYAKVAQFVPEENVLVVRSVSGFSEEHVDTFRLPVEDGSHAGFTLAAQHPVQTSDFRSETRFEVPDIPGVALRSGIAVVIAGAEPPWGVLEVDSEEPREYSTDEAGFLRTVAGTLAQAIERNSSELQLRYQATLLDTVNEAVVGVDNEGRTVYWNRRAEEMFGWSSQEMMGRIALDTLVVEADRERAFAIRREVLEGRRSADEMRMQRKDATRLTVYAASAPVYRPEGRMVGRVVTIFDISERVELEEKLREAQKMEAMGRLAGGVAHDFNNLLTSIGGFTDLALSEPDCDGPLKGYVEEIRNTTHRAGQLTRRLLAFSRRQALLPQEVDPGPLIESMEPILRNLLGDRIDLVLDTDEPAGLISVDPIQIERVIMNLAVNSRDAMPEGGTLTIATRSSCPEEAPVGTGGPPAGDHYAVISVQDTGTGIPPEIQRHVFDPFFTTKTEGRGTGLGLATVHGIVEQSGGTILMDSQPGQGTTFSICLPLSEASAPEARRTHPEEKRGVAVLVAEDEEGVRTLLVQALSRRGYHVLEAVDGVEALKRFREYAGEIELVLSDVIMPRMSGFELAAALRRERPDLPVIFMSGYADEVLAGDATPVGSKILQKPFTMDELMDRIEQVEAGSAGRKG